MTSVNPTVTWANHTAMVSGVSRRSTASSTTDCWSTSLASAAGGAVARQDGHGPRAHRVRRRACAGADDGAGGLGGDLECADGDLGVPRTARPAGSDRAGDGRRRPLSQEDVDSVSTRNIVFRDGCGPAAAYIVRAHKPNLMMFHLLTLDSTQHRYGPGSRGAGDDGPPRRAGRRHRPGSGARPACSTWTTSCSCRHGFKPVKRQIGPNVALAQAGAGGGEGWQGRRGPTPGSYRRAGPRIAYVTSPIAGGRAGPRRDRRSPAWRGSIAH